MLLTANDIANEMRMGRIEITPFNQCQLGTNSYDVCLAPNLLRIVDDVLDLSLPYKTQEIILGLEGMYLYPDECYLGVTVERTKTPYHVPVYEGRSTMGRYFIQSHMTAGFGDIGFDNHWTLEITVKKPTKVYPFMRIGQIGFHTTSRQISRQYSGHYSGGYSENPIPRVGVPGNYTTN